MGETGENYTVARRAVIAGRDPGQPPVALRVYLNPHVDLPLTGESARAYAAADEQGQRDMANRLLADHIELAGIGEAAVAAGSELETVQDLWIDDIADAIHRRIPRTAGIGNLAVSGDLDHVKVDIVARRPGLVHGHGHAELDRLRAELEELTRRGGRMTAWSVSPTRRSASRSPILRRPARPGRSAPSSCCTAFRRTAAAGSG
jgi:hypothetical protein